MTDKEPSSEKIWKKMSLDRLASAAPLFSKVQLIVPDIPGVVM